MNNSNRSEIHTPNRLNLFSDCALFWSSQLRSQFMWIHQKDALPMKSQRIDDKHPHSYCVRAVNHLQMHGQIEVNRRGVSYIDVTDNISIYLLGMICECEIRCIEWGINQCEWCYKPDFKTWLERERKPEKKAQRRLKKHSINHRIKHEDYVGFHFLSFVWLQFCRCFAIFE